jgi:hypothetical protein
LSALKPKNKGFFASNMPKKYEKSTKRGAFEPVLASNDQKST